MNKLLAVIRREYRVRVRNKWFIFTTLFAPFLLIAVMGLPALLVMAQPETERRISVIDETGRILPELLETEIFQNGRFRYRPSPSQDPAAARETLLREMRGAELTGFLYFPAEALETGRAEYWSHDPSNLTELSGLSEAVGSIVRRLRAEELGLSSEVAQRLVEAVELETYRVTEAGPTRERGQTWITAQVLALAIYVVILLYGAMMLRAAVEEKTSKMVEIILSSLRPWQLMLGKTLGVGAVGLTQVAVWSLFVVGALVYAGTLQPLQEHDFLQNIPIGPDTVLLFLGLFLTGYFLYAGMYAAVGAIATSEQEAAHLQIPVTVVALVPALILPAVLNDPAATTSLALSWIPPFTPVLFIARYVLGAASTWELGAIFVLQLAAILCVGWLGGRIYRVGLLMTGVRPTVPELWRWIRHG